MADRDFLSSRGDKLSHLFEHRYLLKSSAHLGFEWIWVPETTVSGVGEVGDFE